MPEVTAADGARETGTVLDRIVADRRVRLAEDRAATPEARFAELEAALPGGRVDFASRLREGRRGAPAGARLRLIAEIKRASPSKGLFDADLDAAEQAREYASAGASAVSVMTEPSFFRGGIADLRAAREAFGEDLDRPALLRKDFIFDAYQVREARANGADALLLIVMMLEPAALRDLIALTRAEGLEPLVEVDTPAGRFGYGPVGAADVGGLVAAAGGRAQGQGASEAIGDGRDDGEAKAAALIARPAALEALGEARESLRRNDRAVIGDGEQAVGCEVHLDHAIFRAVAERIVDEVAEQDAEGIGVEVVEIPPFVVVVERAGPTRPQVGRHLPGPVGGQPALREPRGEDGRGKAGEAGPWVARPRGRGYGDSRFGVGRVRWHAGGGAGHRAES